ncbi:NifU family protein [Saccharopolyspora phatthalungensis]|uniref:Fe-S cluster biogenesis protein NfuA/nitrite reductase/ring-hydroxylating ferredoxin subunit n=1 Tax=Saccharopolyspora phatthalungensis TaxID=664693 RepID=A0A840PQK5_9PSEU|nr:NifU family protein [Saccharopolyspora phatthalungensis]MBB5152582.1 Fe-S cluster biogenesis protein NfuA/nitrite reductase/ring-hydroxylating ferredoxin subunit [Saccharopolyspora phatthalungensis]
MVGQDEASAVAARIDQLLAEFDRDGDAVAAERAEELVRAIVPLYGEGLGRIVQILRETDGGALHAELAADPLVGGLLALHDLHPSTVEERVAAALEEVRPYLGSHSGDVELLGIDERSVVRLRLTGSCESCPSSTVTVKLAIENAIREAVPEVTDIEVEGIVEPERETGPGGRPLLPVVPSGPGTAWVDVAAAGDLAPGEVTVVTVDHLSLVMCRTDGDLYAYLNNCPSCSNPFTGALLDGVLLECPRCRERYDVRRAGRAEQRAAQSLSPLPLLTDAGSVRVALPAEVAS